MKRVAIWQKLLKLKNVHTLLAWHFYMGELSFKSTGGQGIWPGSDAAVLGSAPRVQLPDKAGHIPSSLPGLSARHMAVHPLSANLPESRDGQQHHSAQ